MADKWVGSAPGNFFFAGEHGVMYGTGAISTSIDLRTTVEVEKRNDEVIFLDSKIRGDDFGKARFKIGKTLTSIGEVTKDMELVFKVLSDFYSRFGDKQGCNIRILSDIPPVSGLSSSTALITALYATIAKAYNHHIDDYWPILKPLQDFAHGGKSSGTELIASLHGGLVLVESGEPKQYKSKFDAIVGIGYTGKHSTTSYMLEIVRKRKDADQKEFEKVIEGIKACVAESRKQMEAGELVALGASMNRNHSLLRELGVSSPELELGINICRKHKEVLGAKLSGGGGGKSWVVLFDGEAEEVAGKIRGELSSYGMIFLYTKMNVEGLKVEKNPKN